jgi:hypothetical protein
MTTPSYCRQQPRRVSAQNSSRPKGKSSFRRFDNNFIDVFRERAANVDNSKDLYIRPSRPGTAGWMGVSRGKKSKAEAVVSTATATNTATDDSKHKTFNSTHHTALLNFTKQRSTDAPARRGKNHAQPKKHNSAPKSGTDLFLIDHHSESRGAIGMITKHTELPMNMMSASGKTEYPIKSYKGRCWWDHHEFQGDTYGCPVAYDHKTNTFTMEGMFCSDACAAAWGSRNDLSNTMLNKINQAQSLLRVAKLKHSKQKLTVNSMYIPVAGSYLTIDSYGGPFTIEQFRRRSKDKFLVDNVVPAHSNFRPVAAELWVEDKTKGIPVFSLSSSRKHSTHRPNLNHPTYKKNENANAKRSSMFQRKRKQPSGNANKRGGAISTSSNQRNSKKQKHGDLEYTCAAQKIYQNPNLAVPVMPSTINNHSLIKSMGISLVAGTKKGKTGKQPK